MVRAPWTADVYIAGRIRTLHLVNYQSRHLCFTFFLFLFFVNVSSDNAMILLAYDDYATINSFIFLICICVYVYCILIYYMSF